MYLKAKADPKSKNVENLEKDLWEIEKLYRTDVLLQLRQAVIVHYYESLGINYKSTKKIQLIKEESTGIFRWN